MHESESFLPIIYPVRCNGCSECVRSCPSSALAMVDGLAVLIAPDLCAYCATCEERCPQGAISLPYEIVMDPIS